MDLTMTMIHYTVVLGGVALIVYTLRTWGDD